jgi:CTP:molybdopterin cytidylyltransferase MocA
MAGQILILAAGESGRMRGRDKLLEPVRGAPQLRRIATHAMQTGWPVLVTLPDLSHARAGVLADLCVRLVPVPDAAEGMGASLRAGGAAHMEEGDFGPLMVLPADLPDLEDADLSDVIAAHERSKDRIHCGACGSRRGHPVILPTWLVPELATLTGDQGAKALIAAYADRIVLTPLAGQRAVLDLDTPEAWAAWRARRS